MEDGHRGVSGARVAKRVMLDLSRVTDLVPIPLRPSSVMTVSGITNTQQSATQNRVLIYYVRSVISLSTGHSCRWYN